MRSSIIIHVLQEHIRSSRPIIPVINRDKKLNKHYDKFAWGK